MKLIDKDALVAEIDRLEKKNNESENVYDFGTEHALKSILSFIDTLEVKDPYEQCVQYDSIEAGIQAHAETYSFNIKSELFHQLTKEQQKLWRKEIEQACISGGEVGVELARDIRYKENLEVKEVDLDFQRFAKEMDAIFALPSSETKNTEEEPLNWEYAIAKHFFELGLKAQKGK